MTLVILALCPCKLYFSGSRGKPSPSCLFANGPPRSLLRPSLSHRSHIPPCCLSYLFNFSNCMFSSFSFARPFHFLSKTSVLTTDVTFACDIVTSASSQNYCAVELKPFFIKYSRIAEFSSCFSFAVRPTIFGQ